MKTTKRTSVGRTLEGWRTRLDPNNTKSGQHVGNRTLKRNDSKDPLRGRETNPRTKDPGYKTKNKYWNKLREDGSRGIYSHL